MPARSGFSKTRLERLNDVMAEHVERGVAPGVVWAVSRNGETYIDAVGAKAVGGERLDTDTIFRISSMTKPVTAVAAMVLIEECVIRLDEPVDRWLPELAEPRVLKSIDGPVEDTVPANRPVTVRDLLTFRMGKGMLLTPPEYPIQKALAAQGDEPGPPRPQSEPPPDEWMRRMFSLPLFYQPGEQWLYHTGSDVLGVLIARASGKSLESFMRERIFEPLGMKDTAFSVPAEKVARLATSYGTDPETGALFLLDESEGGQWSSPPVFESGGGGLVSTIDDYLAFAQMLLNNGEREGERVLSRPTVELMTTNHLTPDQLASGFLADRGWGFGMSVFTRRDYHASVGSYGWDGGMGTSWANDPNEGLVGIQMTQAAWTSPQPPNITVDFWTSVYAAIN